MQRTSQQLRSDARSIWQAGVDAVLPDKLLPEFVQVEGSTLRVGEDAYDLGSVSRMAVVGAGKAAGGMAVALEEALGDELLSAKQVTGWVNVPADCLVPTQRIHLHAGRPAGVNEPRPEGIAGTREILKIVDSLGPHDLCFCLLAGGGSALLVAPVPEITLQQKTRITQLLSGAGANIEQLNTVRRALSLIKGGGLARACRAGKLITLIISDVLGDPLDVIASGPTVASSTTPADALAVLQELALIDHVEAAPVVEYLRSKATVATGNEQAATTCEVTNLIVANNATAVDAAGMQAERLGYSHAMLAATGPEGPAEEVGYHLAEMAQRMLREAGPDCLITGGEPVVHLADEAVRGKGGRNQQLALAALTRLGDCQNLALLAGGTDGEDGPTDAAGAWIDEQIAAAAKHARLDASDYLERNDAYHFFGPLGGLIKTGPTHTNVCDLRVVTVSRD